MPLVEIVILAVVQGTAEALPISRSGHDAAAAIFVEGLGARSAIADAAAVAAAIAFLVIARRRLGAAIAEGVRGVARPTLFLVSPAARDAALLGVAVTVSMLASAIVGPMVEGFRDAPLASGLGLLVTGLALLSTRLAPAPHSDAPSLTGATLVGLAHGLSVFPGASRVGAALVLLLWLGVRPARALELAFVLTAITLLASAAPALVASAHALDAGAMVLASVLTFTTAAFASSALRSLLEKKRTFALAAWIIPLGLAMIAYARALPVSI